MPRWKELLLNLYYYGGYPLRNLRNSQLRTKGQAPVMVLFYHRIADDEPNAWTASNAAFERQIRWLKRHFDMVSLAEAQHRIRNGYNSRPTITVTFDDGYADNCQRALPFLIEQKVPCTYFVASRHILEGRPFAHDVKRGRPLAPNTPEQIRELAAAGIDIGAHTRTHADLGQVKNIDTLYDEMIGSQRDLQEITGQPVRYFAFPFGQHKNLTPDAFELARTAFDGVCSAYGGYNFPGGDPFHFQRIHVDEDLIRLKNWVTLDPRKLRITPRYEYQTLATELFEPVGAGA
jgi:peptidoglycan/xylan/chitin deacetylase (PgdA/CDA1 family)